MTLSVDETADLSVDEGSPQYLSCVYLLKLWRLIDVQTHIDY